MLQASPRRRGGNGEDHSGAGAATSGRRGPDHERAVRPGLWWALGLTVAAVVVTGVIVVFDQPSVPREQMNFILLRSCVRVAVDEAAERRAPVTLAGIEAQLKESERFRLVDAGAMKPVDAIGSIEVAQGGGGPLAIIEVYDWGQVVVEPGRVANLTGREAEAMRRTGAFELRYVVGTSP